MIVAMVVVLVARICFDSHDQGNFFISFTHSAYSTFRIIMPFRKSRHMPLRKLILALTFTVFKTGALR